MLHTRSSITHTLMSLLVVCALALATAACDSQGPEGPRGPQGPDGPQGPAGEDGTQGPQGPPGDDGQDGQDGEDGQDGQDGEDGNANVTMYVFDGRDFSSDATHQLCLGEGLSQQEVEESEWDVYMGFDNPSVASLVYFHIPGYGINSDSEYHRGLHAFDDGAFCGSAQPIIEITRTSGPGEDYEEIRVVRTEASSVEDCTGGGCLRATSEPIIPENLDMTDYNAVVEYYGITEDDTVYM